MNMISVASNCDSASFPIEPSILGLSERTGCLGSLGSPFGCTVKAAQFHEFLSDIRIIDDTLCLGPWQGEIRGPCVVDTTHRFC